MLLRFLSLAEGVRIGHLFVMLDVMRARESVIESRVSLQDFREMAKSISIPPTSKNLLALMFAIGAGRFLRVVYVVDN